MPKSWLGPTMTETADSCSWATTICTSGALWQGAGWGLRLRQGSDKWITYRYTYN